MDIPHFGANLSALSQPLYNRSREALMGGLSSRVSDITLVHRARQGDAQALNVLVTRHRHEVLLLCRRLLDDWDLAEDAAQEALLEAARTLHVLRELRSFRAWLRTITVHSAARQRLRAERDTSLLQPLAAEVADEPPAIHDLLDTIREALRELSARDRKVVTLHYLQGLSCAEVARRLRTPEGTVKRVLHESRTRLRKEVGVVSESEGKLQGPRRMTYWVHGEGAGYAPLRPLLAQALCLCVNKRAKTARQIAREVDANIQYVHETAEVLAECEILRLDSARHYQANFIALDADDWTHLADFIHSQAGALADALRPHLRKLRAAWSDTPVAKEGFAWAQAKWPLVALLVLNTGLERNADLAPGAPPLRASGYRFWLGGRELTPETPRIWMLGFNSTGYETNGLHHGHFNTAELPRAGGVFVRGLEPLALTAIAKGAETAAQVCARVDAPRERVQTALAALSKRGLLSSRSGRLRLTFPVFTEENSSMLVPLIDQISSSLLEHVLDPALEDLGDRLDQAGYGHVREQFPVWYRWTRGDISAEALRHLIASRDLPRPPEPAPHSFCFVGWLGSPSVMQSTQRGRSVGAVEAGRGRKAISG